MAATGEPSAIQAGDTLAWTRSLSDYPAPTWALAYVLLNAANRYTFTTTADGSDHAVSVAAATTAAWAAGQYRLLGQVSKAGVVATVCDIPFEVKASAAAAVETRSALRRELDVIEAWYGGDRSVAVRTKTIGTRSLEYWDPKELLAYYEALRSAVAKEEAAARLESGLPAKAARVLMRF